ncbi:isochorismatase family protein [Achromobacter xylosoxidans]|uniref:Isochorismatase family protein n=1 Tax=Alcaligenes xylosoxydans xylosoxydans TaxID=85698 RepID=A0A9X3L403_ALCXX|nr:isochorismatase family protein [Achromobacter xylosoxidans]MCZ8405342.1 isochorismatase family protein [Achromobacter xylosoxidans]
MLLNADDSQVVLVDFQTKLMPAIHEGQAVLGNAVRLARLAQLLHVPLCVTEHCPEKLGGTDPALATFSYELLEKFSFSAVPAGLADRLSHNLAGPQFVDSNVAWLQRPVSGGTQSRRTILLAGCEAHVCLLQTALDLVPHAYRVCVVTDACGSRSPHSRDLAYQRLASAGVELVTLEMVAFEWIRVTTHPAWKEALAIIK